MSDMEKFTEEYGEGFIKFCVNLVVDAVIDRNGGFSYPPDPSREESERLREYVVEAIKKGPRYIDGDYLVDTFDNSKTKIAEINPDTGGMNENWWSPTMSEPVEH